MDNPWSRGVYRNSVNQLLLRNVNRDVESCSSGSVYLRSWSEGPLLSCHHSCSRILFNQIKHYSSFPLVTLEGYDNTLSIAVDIAHNCNLLAEFFSILLVDTDCINPK